MRLRFTAGLLIPSAALLTACGGSGSSADAGAVKGATPALSKAQAAEVLKRFETANNRAGKSMDGKVLATAETGPQLEMDVAAYKLRKAAKQRFRPFEYAQPTFYIPRLSGYPRWFVVDTISQEPARRGKPTDKDANLVRHALMFAQDKADASWLLTADPYPAGTPLSSIAMDKDGYAVAVRPEAKLAVTPGGLGTAHASLLTNGPQTAVAKAVAPGPQTSQAYDGLRQATDQFKGIGVTLTSRFAPHPGPVRALRTTDGGALVWYALKQNESYRAAKPGKIAVTGDLVGLAPAKVARTRLDTTVLIQYLAKVPSKGQASVTGMYRKAVLARAS